MINVIREIGIVRNGDTKERYLTFAVNTVTSMSEMTTSPSSSSLRRSGYGSMFKNPDILVGERFVGRWAFQFLLNRASLSFGNWKRWCFHFTLWHLVSVISKVKCLEESIDCSLFIVLWLDVSNSNRIRSFITLRKSPDKPRD